MPFEEIAGIIDRSPAAVRQLSSRARHRVQGVAPDPDPDVDGRALRIDMIADRQRLAQMDGEVM